MSFKDWNLLIHDLVDNNRAILWPPAATEETRSSVTDVIGTEHIDFINFYSLTNGLSLQWLTILPNSEVPAAPFITLREANDVTRTPYLGANDDLLSRFAVFADIGGGSVAAVEKSNGIIWHEEDGELVQTTLDLESFILTCLREMV